MRKALSKRWNEFKNFVDENDKGILLLGLLVVTLALMFIIPKIILAITCILLFYGVGVIILTLLSTDFISSYNKGLKHSKSSKTLYIMLYALTDACFIYLIYLAIKLCFFGL